MTATADAQDDPPAPLNQVTYCPRLYYLQYVDCVMPTNEHVEGGLFDHRRVDAGDLANKTRARRAMPTAAGASTCRPKPSASAAFWT